MINKHELDGSSASGNGHHGHCKHCDLPYVSDLGYNSWKDTTCIDRKIEGIFELNDDIKSYCRFKGLIFNKEKQLFIKPYSNLQLSFKELNKNIIRLKIYER